MALTYPKRFQAGRSRGIGAVPPNTAVGAVVGSGNAFQQAEFVRTLRRSAALEREGTQPYFPQSGVEETQGNPYPGLPDVQAQVARPLDPGINQPGFVNPFRTIMYSVTGLSTSQPVRAIPGNFRRTYLMVQNLGPGNMFLGIGVDPNAGGANVLNLVSTQIYEQIGGGFFLPPNEWFPQGLSVCASFVSPEYVSLLTDTAGTNAMIVEGSYFPPRSGATRPGA